MHTSKGCNRTRSASNEARSPAKILRNAEAHEEFFYDINYIAPFLNSNFFFFFQKFHAKEREIDHRCILMGINRDRKTYRPKVCSPIPILRFPCCDPRNPLTGNQSPRKDVSLVINSLGSRVGSPSGLCCLLPGPKNLGHWPDWTRRPRCQDSLIPFVSTRL